MTFVAKNCLPFIVLAFVTGCGGSTGASQAATGSAAQTAAESTKPVAASSSPSSALQRVIEGAKAEGKVALEYDENSGGGSKAVALWSPLFNKTYGLSLNVQYTPGGDYGQQSSKVIQETQAGRATSSDILITSSTYVPSLLQTNAIEATDWASWAPNIQNPKLLEGQGAVVRWYAQLPGIMYNTDKIKGDAIPKTMQDLLKPQYKGVIAGHTNAAQFDYLATPAMWGTEKTETYAAAFSKQFAGLIRCGEGQRVASGEFSLFGLDCGSYEARWLHSQGAPVAEVIPSDAAIIAYTLLAVPKSAPHPNAARLWVNYLLSQGAQEILYQTKGPDNPYVPGSKTIAEMKAVQDQHATFTEVSTEFSQKYQADTAKAKQNIIKMFTNR